MIVLLAMNSITWTVAIALAVGWHAHAWWEETRLLRQTRATPAPREEEL